MAVEGGGGGGGGGVDLICIIQWLMVTKEALFLSPIFFVG